jgi:hypothetical protein
MQTKTLVGLGVLFVSLLLLGDAAFADSRRSHRGRGEVRESYREVQRSKAELRKDLDELRRSRGELRRDTRRGSSRREIARDRAEIREDLREVARSRRELGKDRAELRRDLDKYGYGNYSYRRDRDNRISGWWNNDHRWNRGRTGSWHNPRDNRYGWWNNDRFDRWDRNFGSE